MRIVVGDGLPDRVLVGRLGRHVLTSGDDRLAVLEPFVLVVRTQLLGAVDGPRQEREEVADGRQAGADLLQLRLGVFGVGGGLLKIAHGSTAPTSLG